MPRIVTEKFSTFYDVTTKVQFNPLMDLRRGLLIGMAQVDEETAAQFDGRDGFRRIEDAEYLAMTTRPRDPEPVEPVTGDPLADEAQREEQKVKADPSGSSPVALRPSPPAPPHKKGGR